MNNPPNILNPDSAILQQLDGQWQKVAALLLWKLAGVEKVTITCNDMEEMARQFHPGQPCIFTHGHQDSIDFQVLDEKAASRIAEFEATQRGSA